jgi:16S rRNA (guanine527-N7)-methyltransferase
MAVVSVAARIAERALLAGVAVSSPLASRLASYVGLLAKWTKTINLTALEVDPPSDRAIDRLIVEALVAERLVDSSARLAMDIGTGGGSPAIPLKLARPSLRMVLVESKSRKCAFLREVVRELGLDDVEVANARLESVATRSDLRASADLVTLRAVRLDEEVWSHVAALAKSGGQVLYLGTGPLAGRVPGPFVLESTTTIPSSGTAISVIRRA